VPRGKEEEEKEERRCVVFSGINILVFFLFFVVAFFLFIVVIFFYSFQICNYSLFQNFVKTMYNVLMINKVQVFFLFIKVYPF
jgi:hypothetical protein